jgi:VWFA-related protein
MTQTARMGICLTVMAILGFPLVFAQSDTSAPAVGPLTVLAGQKIIMQLETPMHTRTTKKGEHIEFTTAGEVFVENQMVVPTKSLIRGTVTKSKRAGLLYGRAEILLRFEDIKLADGTVVPFKATITRVGFDPVDGKTGEVAEIKGDPGAGGDGKAIASTSAQGAVIGVLSGGLHGAMYGAAAGAAVAVVQSALRRGPDIDLPRSTMFEVRVDVPFNVSEIAILAAQKPVAAPSDKQPRVAGNSGGDDRPQIADSSTGASGRTTSDDGSVTPRRPVLKRRSASAEESTATGTAATQPVDLPEEEPATIPVKQSSRASVDLPPLDPTTPTISVRVRMVQVDAVVRDRSGRMMDNLPSEDFRIYEDGVLQQVQSFSRDELPIAVALVVDRSGSVAPYINELRRIAGRALNQLKRGDEVCLFSFATDVERLEDLTTDRQRIAYALDRIHAGGGTDITGALHAAVKYLSRSAPGYRHAVILVSDNQQTVNSSASETETIKTAMESETVVYSLKTSGSPLQIGSQLPSLVFGSGPVGKITQETGGEIMNVGSTSSLDSALGAVISRLRMRYSLGYYPSGTAQGGAFHEIKVRLDDRFGKAGSDYFMHAKRGYYATGGSQGAAADARLQLVDNR